MYKYLLESMSTRLYRCTVHSVLYLINFIYLINAPTNPHVFIKWSKMMNFSLLNVLRASTCNTDTTQTQPHQFSKTQRTENKTTDVVIQQHSRKLMMMDILLSETCWAHKKWNKIASDIKLVFHSSTILKYIRCSRSGSPSDSKPIKEHITPWNQSRCFVTELFKYRK